MPNPKVSLSAKLLANPPKNGCYYLIAIDGRSAAGKTTLTSYLQDLMPGFSVINGDDYFEPIEHPITWGGYNEERFYQDVIKPLSQTQTTINFRPYDWDSQSDTKSQTININKGLFIDRCYSFSFDLNYDLKVWVEAPRDLTLNRGISRSSMPKERAEKVWRELWKPLEDEYIKETNPKDMADIVIDGTQSYDQQIVA